YRATPAHAESQEIGDTRADRDTQEASSDLVLEPPEPVTPVSADQAASAVKVAKQTAQQIDGAVKSFVESLSGLNTHSPDFQRKVQSVSQMGNQEIRRSSEVSNRF